MLASIVLKSAISFVVSANSADWRFVNVGLNSSMFFLSPRQCSGCWICEMPLKFVGVMMSCNVCVTIGPFIGWKTKPALVLRCSAGLPKSHASRSVRPST